MNAQLDAQERARATPPRNGHLYRVAHVDGSITNHRTFGAAEASWRFGDVVYCWYDDRWAIWTSAGIV